MNPIRRQTANSNVKQSLDSKENMADPTRIAFALGGLTGGGSERAAVNLMKLWTEQGRTVDLITMRGEEKDAFTLPNGVRRIVLGGEGASPRKLVALFKNIPRVWRLRQAIRKSDAPVVVTFLTRNNVYAVIACLGLGRKVVISERNDTTRQKLAWPWPQLRRYLYKYADVVTANSHVAVEGMKPYVPEEKLRFLPNPVVKPVERAAPQRSRRVLNVGRLVDQKRQELIIQAMALLNYDGKNSYNDWTLDLLGEGEEQMRLAGLAGDLELQDRVRLRGFVQDPERFYKTAGIFVLPSEYEGTPNVLLEAMAWGLPSIVSDSLPGAMELVDEGVSGLIFRSGDPDDLAQKMRLLMDDPKLRARLGGAARDKVEDFSPERVIEMWDDVLRD